MWLQAELEEPRLPKVLAMVFGLRPGVLDGDEWAYSELHLLGALGEVVHDAYGVTLPGEEHRRRPTEVPVAAEKEDPRSVSLSV